MSPSSQGCNHTRAGGESAVIEHWTPSGTVKICIRCRAIGKALAKPGLLRPMPPIVEKAVCRYVGMKMARDVARQRADYDVAQMIDHQVNAIAQEMAERLGQNINQILETYGAPTAEAQAMAAQIAANEYPGANYSDFIKYSDFADFGKIPEKPSPIKLAPGKTVAVMTADDILPMGSAVQLSGFSNVTLNGTATVTGLANQNVHIHKSSVADPAVCECPECTPDPAIVRKATEAKRQALLKQLQALTPKAPAEPENLDPERAVRIVS